MASITIVSYNGIQQRARTSAVESNKNQLFKKLELAKSSGYPNSITDCPTPASGNECFTVGGGREIKYSKFDTNPYSAASV